MDELLELISANIPIIIALGIGIFGFLKNSFNKQEEEQEQRRTQPGQPAPDSSGTGNQPLPQQMQPAQQNVNKSDDSNKVESSASQKQSQREALAKQMNVDPDDLDKTEESTNEVKDDLLRPDTGQVNQQQRQGKTQFKKQLTKNSLINGVVMSEVLGRPRALKPYKSVVEDRIKGK